MGGKAVGGGAIGGLIGVLVFIVVASNLISPIITSITDAAGLAVLGSISGGSALVLVMGTVFIAALLVMIVDMMLGGRITGAVKRRVSRRRF